MDKYLPRIADKELELRLEAFGATLIVGPKWCGKTTTAAQQAKSIIYLQDSERRDGYISTASMSPALLLSGEKPKLIDEWQTIPEIWDAVRHDVDQQNKDGLYILTGSNAVDAKKIMHTGIGRISRMKMYPMSLYESGESNGLISLKKLFDDPSYNIDGVESSLSVEELIFAVCRGGWPSSLYKKSEKAKLFVASDYVTGLCELEISSVDGVKRDPKLTRLLLRSYARNISTLAKKTSILADINSKTRELSMGALDSYINALERLFIIEDVPAWCPSIRSASAIRSGHKREFVDPSIAVAALGLSPEYLQTDLKTFGFFFENLCARDLRIYSQASNGSLSYYHDRYDLEADFVLHLNDGRYALIECKLGKEDIEKGAKNLLKIKQLLSEYNATNYQTPLRLPDLMIILTGGKTAYRRQDGICVIPVGCITE